MRMVKPLPRIGAGSARRAQRAGAHAAWPAAGVSSCGDPCERRGTLLIHHVAQKRLEHQQRPQRRAVIARSRLMGVEQMPQIRLVEPAGVEKAWTEHRFANTSSERTAEPTRERDREALLGPVHDLVRQIRFHRLFEKMLTFLTANLE